MGAVPLVTSIPPRLSRVTSTGEEIGAGYQEACVASWRRSGFEPVSVNSRHEPGMPGMQVVAVDRDASFLAARPLVFFHDLLATALAESGGGPFVVSNADVLFPADNELLARVIALEPGEVIVGRRLDIVRPDEATGTPYRNGFDFFAARGEDLDGLADAGLVFGAPWWDHYLPLILHMRGSVLRPIEPTVLHLVHEEQWSTALWDQLGQRFLRAIQARATDPKYRSLLRKAVKGRTGNFRTDLRYSMWKRLPKHAVDEPHQILRRVSDLNVAFLDELLQAQSASLLCR